MCVILQSLVPSTAVNVDVNIASCILLSGIMCPTCLLSFTLLQAKAFLKFLPMFDRVLVERLAAETVTKGGIMIPEKSQGKVVQATVVAVGPGTSSKVFITKMFLSCAFSC